ncbi:MAG: AAA family ATPase [Treponema sp.]|jgi:type II secretory pathway predicted ATPase ExeA|nr:AAA family ATPase [Treponema sp.]
MAMSHLYYNFSRNPFDKQSLAEKDAFPSNDHKQAIGRLSYLKDIRGIGVFTSPPGFGKTFALRCFAKSLDRNLHEVVYVALSTVSLTEFYRQFCAALGLDAPHGKPAMFRAIQDRLFHLFKEKKKPLLLILDEAHELSPAILKDLKMIMNHDFDSLCCFTLVLAGEPHLCRILEKPVHEALRQRITIHYGFSGLSDAETEQYVKHKLRVAGAAESILGEGTLPAIIGYARGCPRLLDNLMNEACLLGAQLEKPSLNTDVIMAAANSLALA